MHCVKLNINCNYCYNDTDMKNLTISTDLKNYLTSSENHMIGQGFHLIEEAKNHMGYFEDFSFVVFPFAKTYEGFLKRVFYDLNFITRTEYNSKHFRVGKVMSPNLVRRLRDRSVYKKICDKVGCDLSDTIWHTWKVGRNEVFHFYAEDIRPITLGEAEEKIKLILTTMEQTLRRLKTDRVRIKLEHLIGNSASYNSLN